MCGIAGWCLRAGVDIDRDSVGQSMIERMRHRGPDASGTKHCDSITLLHARLRIIDESMNGSQPISNESGTVWIVFNGEIYNHRQLRSDLQSRGHVFRGKSDSEVIPHLYEEYGPEYVHHLRGMFAIAIHDTDRKVVHLSRDRFGIKPLFYGTCRSGLAFSSELESLLTFPDIDKSIDYQSVSDYLALGYIPAPRSIYRGVQCLEPGHSLEVTYGDTEHRSVLYQWYHRNIAPRSNISFIEAVDCAEESCIKAVSAQLESDVPLGAMLSGGLDSSLVSAFGQKEIPSGLQTFSVGFRSLKYDETWAAKEVARHIGSRHRVLYVDEGRVDPEYLVGLYRGVGQPFADPSLIVTNYVSRTMRNHITVALSGDGGDECFAGYPLYSRLYTLGRFRDLNAIARNAITRPLSYLSQLAPANTSISRGLQLSSLSNEAIIRRLFSWMETDEHDAIARNHGLLTTERLFARCWKYTASPGLSESDDLASLAIEANFRLTLANGFLTKVDIASMRESLEIRVPFLDENLVDYALEVPMRLKVGHRKTKRIVRSIASRHLPNKISNKPKAGFAVPLYEVLDPQTIDFVHDRLIGSPVLRELLGKDQVYPYARALKGIKGKGMPHGNAIFHRCIMLFSLSLFLETY